MCRIVHLVLGALVIGNIAFAQPAFNPVAKGNKQLGLQVMLQPTDMFYSETYLSINSNEKSYGLHLAPSYSWFIENGWSIGVQTNLGFYSEENNLNESWGRKEKSFDIGVVPNTRYYFNIGRNHRFKPFLLAAVPIVYSSIDETYTDPNSIGFKNEFVELRGSIGFGAAYFGRAGNIELNVSNIGFFLGVNKFFEKKQK